MGPYYRTSCRILNLIHGIYSLKIRDLMERNIVKDKLNYSITTCIKDECDGEHADSKISNDNAERMDK
jgi:hypothetical protein